MNASYALRNITAHVTTICNCDSFLVNNADHPSELEKLNLLPKTNDFRLPFAPQTHKMKKERESMFPIGRLQHGRAARVQEGKASVDKDRQHILNTMAGRGLSAETLDEHEGYERVNRMLHGRVQQLVEGGESSVSA